MIQKQMVQIRRFEPTAREILEEIGKLDKKNNEIFKEINKLLK